MNSSRCAIVPFHLGSIAGLLLAALVVAGQVSAKDAPLNFLQPGKPDPATLLAPPPLMVSAEQDADMAEVKAVFHAASDLDKQAAQGEKKFSVFTFASAIGPWFASNNVPKTAAFFEKAQLDAETVTDLGKQYFKRPRPYSVDPTLANGKLEKSFSYPSGHSTESMVLALVLTDIFPDRREPILAVARNIGWHRVEIARHYPTDIYAGRTLAQAIVREMKENPAFRRGIAEVKSEIQGAVRPAEVTDLAGKSGH